MLRLIDLEHIYVFFSSVVSVEGEKLVLNKITRSESGAYLCIASNGVPPSVSKRILVEVECNFI